MSLEHSFGAWLENFRKERKLTQEKLASQLNYSAEYIRKLEADRRPPTDEVAKRLAEIQGLQGSESQAFVAHLLGGRLPASQPQPAPGEAAPPLTRPTESADPAPGDPPYKGLSFFAEQDAHLYFGRQTLVNELLMLMAQVYNSPSRLLAIIGGSGSGKSSLVRAGLLPALRQGQTAVDPVHCLPDSQRWLVYVMTPTAHPLESLAARLTQGSQSITATSTLIDDLGEDFRTLHLYARRLVGVDNHLLLVIDQFEELFALCKDKQERSALIDNLRYAVKGDGVTSVVLTLRADFYRYCLDYEPLRLLLEDHTKTIGAMSRDELRTAIVGPAQTNGWEFEAGLVDLFLDDVGDEPGALPLLAHALRETWERRQGHTLTLAGYSHIGRVQGAIATTADHTLNGLTAQQRQIAKNIFLRLTELGDGAEDTRRRVRFAELLPAVGDPSTVQQVLKILADARLITTHEDGAEVAHEALIRAWPLLRAWLADDREGLRIHRRLTASAHEWQNLGQDESLLYRGVRLAQTTAWVQEHPAELNDLEQKFIKASCLAAERAKQAQAAALKHELEQQRLLAEAETKRAKLAEERASEQEIAATKLRRRRNFLIAASGLAVLLAVIASSFGLQASRNAAQADQQRSTAVAAQATTTAAFATAEINRANARLQQSTAEAHATVAVAAQATAVVSALRANADRLAMQARILNASTDRNDHDLALLVASQAVTMTWSREGYVLPNADLALVEAIEVAQRNQWAPVVELPHPAPVFSAAASPDGQLIVSASADKLVHIWEAQSGEEVRQFTGHTAPVRAAAFSPNGQLIVSASADGTVRTWAVTTGKEMQQLQGHVGSVTAALFSPDGQQIVSAGEDGTIRLWGVATGREIRQLVGHVGAVEAVVFSPTGQLIVSAGADKTVRVWAVESGTEVRQLTGHAERIWSVAFSQEGESIVATGADRVMYMWNTASGKGIRVVALLPEGAWSVAFRPDGKQVLCANRNGTLSLWDVSSEREVQRLTSHSAAVRSALFSADGQQIISASEDGTVRIWQATHQQTVHQLTGHTGSVRRTAFSPTGDQLISASEDTTIRIWDLPSGQELRQLIGHERSVRSATFSPDGQQIVSASEDGTIRLWDVASGKEIRRLTGHESEVWTAVFSPDGRQIASGGGDETIRLWDVSSGQEVRKLTAHENNVWWVAFSPDGQQLVSTGQDGRVRLWDISALLNPSVASGQEIRQLYDFAGGVWSAEFSADGRQLVSANDDGTAHIFDVASGREIRQLLGHTAGVRAASFSPDGKQIVTASADKTVRLWDVATGQEVRQLVGHTERVLSVAYSPNGQQLVSSSADATIRLWEPAVAKLLAQAQALILRDPPLLTPEERQQYGVE